MIIHHILSSMRQRCVNFFCSVFAVKLIKPAVGARNVPEVSVLLSIREKAANSPEPKSLLVRPTQSSKKDESNSLF